MGGLAPLGSAMELQIVLAERQQQHLLMQRGALSQVTGRLMYLRGCLAGACQDELDKWCAAVKPGEGRLAKCLGDELAVEGQAGSKGTKISEACKKEVISFKIQRSNNINMDLPLAKACKADADKFCANKYEVGCAILCAIDSPSRSLTSPTSFC